MGKSALDHSFASIDGGTLNLSTWAGKPMLVVNTASRCGFTSQYSGMQALYDRFRERGLIVLAVPSDDFRQELDSAEAVKAFCEVNFDLDLPMADITKVTGRQAHPFYKWVATEAGFRPRWNFNKVLIGRDGQIAATFGATAGPQSRRVIKAVEAALGG
ncbi:MAG: glutathione peroxidase [Pseudomonadota bacterium]